MAKGKLVTKSVYLPEKIVERIEINKEENDSFSSCLTKLLKLGLDSKSEQNQNGSYSKNFTSIQEGIQNLKNLLASSNNYDLIDKKFEYFVLELSSKISEEIESKLSILTSDYEKLIEEKFERFRDGLNKISKHIISTDESIKTIKIQLNESKNMR